MMNNPFDIAKGMNLNAFLWEEETNKQLMFRTMSDLVDSYKYDYFIEGPDTLILDALSEIGLTKKDFSDEAWEEITENAQEYFIDE